MTNPRAIICDLDNVLADCSHRLHWIDPNQCWEDKGNYKVLNLPKNWKPDYEAFYAAMNKDGVNEAVSSIITKFKNSWGSYEILFITGRPEKHREATVEWLNEKGLIWTFELFMRPDLIADGGYDRECDLDAIGPNYIEDDRPSAEVKREIFQREIAGKYDILFCLESNQEDARMYRDLGLTVLRVMP